MKKFLLALCMLVSTIAFAQTTPNIALNIPVHGTANWDTYLNANATKLDLYLSGGLGVPNFVVAGNLTVGGVCTGCGGSGFAAAGDLSGNATSQTVIGLNGNPLPGSFSVGCLNWTGSALAWSSCGALTGSGAATQVAVWSSGSALTGYTTFTVDSSGNLAVNTLATTGTLAGMVGTSQGADNSANCAANYICIQAPTSVTKYIITRAGTGPSALSLKTFTALSSSVTTEAFVTLPTASNGLNFNGSTFGAGVLSGFFFGMCNGTVGTANGAAYIFFPAQTSTTTCTATVIGGGSPSNEETPVGAACTASNLAANASTGGAAAGSAVTLYKNNASTALTCSLNGVTSCRDNSHTVAFTAGDVWSIRAVTGQATDTMANMRASFQCN